MLFKKQWDQCFHINKYVWLPQGRCACLPSPAHKCVCTGTGLELWFPHKAARYHDLWHSCQRSQDCLLAPWPWGSWAELESFHQPLCSCWGPWISRGAVREWLGQHTRFPGMTPGSRAILCTEGSQLPLSESTTASWLMTVDQDEFSSLPHTLHGFSGQALEALREEGGQLS